MHNFTPNWKRLGLKSTDDAILLAIGEITKNAKALKKLGLTSVITLIWKGKVVEI